MQVIYVDVLLALNLTVNYLLLLASARLSGAGFSGGRGLLAASAGALYSLVMLAQLSPALLTASKLAVSALMVFLAFGRRTPAEFIRIMVIFYGAGFLFAGLMLLVQLTMSPPSLYYGGGIVYCELPAVWIVLSASAAFLLTDGLRRLFCHGGAQRCKRVKICYGGGSVWLPAVIDTGNSLREPFSGAPVAVCSAKLLEALLPNDYISAAESLGRVPDGMRVVPCRTVSGTALLPAFRPDKLEIECGGSVRQAEFAYVALSRQETGGVLIGGNMVFLEKNDRLRGRKDAAWAEHTE